VLLLINGPPGIGKSTVARRWADDHPRSLVVEIDGLRTQLGGWSGDDGSRTLARELAVDLITGHLARGHDVVVPQYLGRPEFRRRLQELAADADVPFVEVVLTASADAAVTRFCDRRAELAGIGHPEADIPDTAIDAAITDAVERLASATSPWTCIEVDASGDAVATHRALARGLDRLR
jgi:predicted kinase